MKISVETFDNKEVRDWWKCMFDGEQLITNTIFQSWEWNYYWWKIFGEKDHSKELFILVLRDEDTIQSIAPFYIQKRKMINKNLWQKILWIATDYSDYPDLITSPDNFDIKWNLILEYVLKEYPNSWLELWDILQSCGIAQQKKSNADVEYIFDEGSTYLIKHLPGDDNAFLNHLGKNFLKKLNQSERQLKKRGVVTHNMQWQYDRRFSDSLREMNKGKYRNRSFFSNSDNLLFYDSLSNDQFFSKKCFFSTLMLDESIISVLMGFHHANKLYFYLSGYDQNYSAMSPSSLNIFYLMRKAIQHGIASFDFLRGKEKYKYRWNVEEMKSQTWTIVPKKNMSKYQFIETMRKCKSIFK